jgi:hypothetical protein
LASAAQFDGTFYGWHFAPDAGLNTRPAAECEPIGYGSEHATDLDFEAEYLPEGQHTISVVKVACGNVGFSVVKEYSFDSYPGSDVILQRQLFGSKEADLRAPADFVGTCQIARKPAVCVHYMDDATGRGGHLGQIIVIEDGSLDPNAVVFRLEGSEIPFAELMRIMETVVGD